MSTLTLNQKTKITKRKILDNYITYDEGINIDNKNNNINDDEEVYIINKNHEEERAIPNSNEAI